MSLRITRDRICTSRIFSPIYIRPIWNNLLCVRSIWSVWFLSLYAFGSCWLTGRLILILILGKWGIRRGISQWVIDIVMRSMWSHADSVFLVFEGRHRSQNMIVALRTVISSIGHALGRHRQRSDSFSSPQTTHIFTHLNSQASASPTNAPSPARTAHSGTLPGTTSTSKSWRGRGTPRRSSLRRAMRIWIRWIRRC